jgi:hypothetical protein
VVLMINLANSLMNGTSLVRKTHNALRKKPTTRGVFC